MLYEFFVKAISLSNDEQEKFLQEVKVNHADIYQELLDMLADDQTSKEHATQYWGELISEHSSQILKPERSLVGETLGVFTLTELIANGGMGSVYKANRSDGQFEQVVAIKVIYSALEEVIGEQALIREAGFMAKLTHPNIGKVFDAGLSEHGMRYIVMEFIEGVTIDQYFQDNQISLKKKLTLFADICDAINHAHQLQIVHADLKPSNILVDKESQVKILDFGIARMFNTRESDNTSIYATYLNAMTADYASPELLAGERPSMYSDIFALGKILAGLVEQAGAPSLYRAELESVAAKATAEANTARYPSVLDLKREVERFIHKKVVEAYSATPWYRLRKFVLLRHPIASISAMATSFVIGALLLSLMWQNDNLLVANEQSDLMTKKLTQVLELIDRRKNNGAEVTTDLLLSESSKILDDKALSPDSVAKLKLTIAANYSSSGYTAEARVLYKSIIDSFSALEDKGNAFLAGAYLSKMHTGQYDLDLIHPDTELLLNNLSFDRSNPSLPNTKAQALFYHRYLDGVKYIKKDRQSREDVAEKHAALLRAIIEHYWQELTLAEQAEVTGFLGRGLLTHNDFVTNSVYGFEQVATEEFAEIHRPRLLESIALINQSIELHYQNGGLDDVARGEIILAKEKNVLNPAEASYVNAEKGLALSTQVLGIGHPHLINRYGELSKAFLYSDPKKSVELALKSAELSNGFKGISNSQYLLIRDTLLDALFFSGDFQRYQDVAQEYFQYYLSLDRSNQQQVANLVVNAMKEYYKSFGILPNNYQRLLLSLEKDSKELLSDNIGSNVEYGTLAASGLLEDLQIIADSPLIGNTSATYLSAFKQDYQDKSALYVTREKIDSIWRRYLFEKNVSADDVIALMESITWNKYESELSAYKIESNVKLGVILAENNKLELANNLLIEAKSILKNNNFSANNAWQIKIRLLEACIAIQSKQYNTASKLLEQISAPLSQHFPQNAVFQQLFESLNKKILINNVEKS